MLASTGSRELSTAAGCIIMCNRAILEGYLLPMAALVSVAPCQDTRYETTLDTVFLPLAVGPQCMLASGMAAPIFPCVLLLKLFDLSL